MFTDIFTKEYPNLVEDVLHDVGVLSGYLRNYHETQKELRLERERRLDAEKRLIEQGPGKVQKTLHDKSTYLKCRLNNI